MVPKIRILRQPLNPLGPKKAPKRPKSAQNRAQTNPESDPRAPKAIFGQGGPSGPTRDRDPSSRVRDPSSHGDSFGSNCHYYPPFPYPFVSPMLFCFEVGWFRMNAQGQPSELWVNPPCAKQMMGDQGQPRNTTKQIMGVTPPQSIRTRDRSIIYKANGWLTNARRGGVRNPLSYPPTNIPNSHPYSLTISSRARVNTQLMSQLLEGLNGSAMVFLFGRFHEFPEGLKLQ